jgi:hypothetical protein
VLERFAAVDKRLGDLQGEYFATVMFDETYAQRDGIITRQDDPSFQPTATDEWVISGPHFYVGNPLSQTPRLICQTRGTYDDIDLMEIPEDYLPRAVYRPGNRKGDLAAFYDAIPEWPKPSQPGFWPVRDEDIPFWEWVLGEPIKLYRMAPHEPGAKTARQFAYFSVWEGPVEDAVVWLRQHKALTSSTEFSRRFGIVRLQQQEPDEKEMQRLPVALTVRYRYINRKRVYPGNERTLIPGIIPPVLLILSRALAFPLKLIIKQYYLQERTQVSALTSL